MNYLVTGGAGFIGSHIVAALTARGDRVRILDNFSTGKEKNIIAGAEVVKGDIRDEKTVFASLRDIDYVIHQAALPSVARSFLDPYESVSVNAGGTLQLLSAARQAKVKAFVYASSSSVYGDSDASVRKEEMPPQPLSPYASGKLLGEQYCILFRRLYGLNTIALRYFNVFGPRQDPNSQYSAVIPRFIQALRRGGPVTIYGDGTQVRDFTYVGNVVSANLKAVAAREGSFYNIGCGKPTDVNMLAKTIEEILGTSYGAKYDASRPGDVYRSCADISKGREELGYLPEVDLEEGLKRTIKYYEEN